MMQILYLITALIVTEIIGVASYKIDLSTLDVTNTDLWCHLCHVPLLAVDYDEITAPTHYFSLEKGGRIYGSIKIASAGEVDPRLVTNDDNIVDGFPVIPVHISNLASRQRFVIRKRSARKNARNSQHDLLYLFNILFNNEEPKTSAPGNLNKDEDTRLDNVYLLLLTQNQLDMYLSSNPLNTFQPSRNKSGFIYYSHVISKLRIPITKIGEGVYFEFEADESGRFALLLFNTHLRELKLEGSVTYLNPSGNHLPIEMYYHSSILKFWVIIFMTASVVTFFYLIAINSLGTKMVNYMLSFNYFTYSLFLYLDMLIVKSVRYTGTYSEVVWALCHLTKRLHEIYFLLLLVLLSFGWKILRDQLTIIESKLILSVVLVSIFMGFVEVLVNGYDITRYLVHAVSCVCILIAINFNSVIINSRISDEGLTQQAGLAYSHMKMFSNFRIIFFTYILKPVVFSSVRFLCLQASIEQILIWDEHVNLFLDVAFDFGLFCALFLTFLPPSKRGLFTHILQNQTTHVHEE